jgi:hypothetical protein
MPTPSSASQMATSIHPAHKFIVLKHRDDFGRDACSGGKVRLRPLQAIARFAALSSCHDDPSR